MYPSVGAIESISIADIFVKRGEGTGLKERTKQQSRAVRPPAIPSRQAVSLVPIEKDGPHHPDDHLNSRTCHPTRPTSIYVRLVVTVLPYSTHFNLYEESLSRALKLVLSQAAASSCPLAASMILAVFTPNVRLSDHYHLSLKPPLLGSFN